jgi:hypothetical protein
MRGPRESRTPVGDETAPCTGETTGDDDADVTCIFPASRTSAKTREQEASPAERREHSQNRDAEVGKPISRQKSAAVSASGFF